MSNEQPLVRYNSAQLVILRILSSVNGLVSFIATATMVVAILRSERRLTTPFRRIIFGMSIHNILFSMIHMPSSLLSPPGSDSDDISGNDSMVNPFAIGGGWELGNDTTCKMQGFIVVLSYNGAAVYLLSLCVYFLCIVKYNMRTSNFEKKVEPILHLFSNSYGFILALIVLFADMYHPGPIVCRVDQYITKRKYVLIVLMIVSILTWVLMVVVMGSICWTVWSQEHRNRTQIFTPVIDTGKGTHQDYGAESGCCSFLCNNSKNEHGDGADSANINSNSLQSHLRRFSVRSRRAGIVRGKGVMKQSLLYTGTFLLIRLPLWIYAIMSMCKRQPPFFVPVMSAFLVPLQGLLIILVYTSTHVETYRRNHTEVSWIQGFWSVVKLGGELPVSTRRRSSLTGIRRASLQLLEDAKKVQGIYVGESDSEEDDEKSTILPIALENLMVPYPVETDAEQTVSSCVKLSGTDRIGSLEQGFGDISHDEDVSLSLPPPYCLSDKLDIEPTSRINK
jgi:hypothetical protein